jgi:ribosome-binding protein aMBF1 (putative translation factor)
MIKNERQYAITKAQAEKFTRALAQLTHQSAKRQKVHPLLRKAEEQALRSQLADLRAEMQEYQSLRSGKYPPPKISSIGELARLLIQARIASGFTHKELAEKLGLKEQQIQRYEATDYASASLSRLMEVSRALAIDGSYPAAAPSTRGRGKTRL